MKQKVYCGIYPKTIDELKRRIIDCNALLKILDIVSKPFKDEKSHSVCVCLINKIFVH